MVHNDEQPTIKRCAIYSRSLVEKDNRDPFDSFSAQFMARSEFIGSQVGRGWRLATNIITSFAEFDLSLVMKRLINLEGLSEELFSVHQKHLVTQLIDRITVHTDRLDIDFNLDGLTDLILELISDRPNLVRMYRQLYSFARSHGLRHLHRDN